MPSAADARAGGAFVELWAKDTTAKTLKEVEDRIKNLGKTVGLFGAAMAAAGAAMTAPFLRGLGVAAEWGRETQTAMRETGLSFAEFDLLSDGMRVGAEELVPALSHMSSFLQDAANGSEEAARRLDMMHLSLDGLIGASQGERALRIADSISRIGDVAQRVAMQRAIFGRGGLALNIEGGRAGIEERDRRAEFFQGPALNSEAALIAIRVYNAAVREMGQVTQGIWASIGQSVTPAMVGFVRMVTQILVVVREWIDRHQNLIAVVFILGGVLTTLGTVVTALGSAFWLIGGALTAFRTVVGGVWAVVTSLGGALALIQYTAMIIGFGTISTVVLAARAALYSYKVAMVGVTAATWLYNFAIGVYEGLMGTVTVATAAATGVVSFSKGVWLGHTIAVYAATAAAWLYNAAMWALTTGFGVLTVIQGVAAVGAATWLWLTTSSAITTWLYNAAVGALSGALAVLSAAYTFVTVTLWSMTAAEIVAYVWETLLTAGTNLLAGAFYFLLGGIVIVTSALAVFAGGIGAIAVAAGLLGVRFASFHRSLGWIDDVVDFVRSIPSMIVVSAWDYLISTITGFVRGVVDALAAMRNAVASVWTGINNLIDAFDSDSLGPFLQAIGFAAIGLMMFIPLWNYLITQFVTFENVSNATVMYLDMIRDAFAALADIIAQPYRQLMAMIDGVIASVEATINAWIAWLQSIGDAIIAPFIRFRDWIVNIFTGAIAWVRAQFTAFVAFINSVIDRILGPFAALKDRIVQYFVNLVNLIGNYFGGLVTAVQSVYARIVNAFGDAIGRIRQFFADLVAFVRSLFSGRIFAIIRDAWYAMVSAARAAVALVVTAFDLLRTSLLAPFIAVRDWIYATFGSIIDTITAAIRGAANAVLAVLLAPFHAINAAFVALFREMWATAVSFFNSWVRIGQEAVSAIVTITRATRDTFVGVWNAFASGFMETMNRVIGTATEAGQAIWTAISSTFSRLSADAQRVWDGIRRAFNAGDWGLIWQIAKAAASVGWLEIKTLGMQAWVEVKFAAMTIFDEIAGYLGDAFDDAWVAIRKGFNTVLGEIKAVWAIAMGEATAQVYQLAARNPLMLPSQRAELEEQAASARAGGQAAALIARGNARRDNGQLDRDAAGRFVDNEAMRVQREIELEAARAREREAARTGTAAELAEARRVLDELLRRAHELPEGVRNGAGAFEMMGARAQVMGTFSAEQARAYGSQTANQALEEARRSRERLERIVELLERMEAAGGDIMLMD
ncbi:MAG TPA: hypothetical protein VFE62_01590 [Gemmataceae bacterium]|nr:hypothetical protein [Gemmataceae bacterium]